MTAASFLETLLSLSMQTAALVLITAFLVRLARREQIGDRLWASCHLLIHLMTIAAVALPHFRIFPLSSITNPTNLARVAAIEHSAGRAVFLVWLAGASISGLALILGAVYAVRVLSTAVPIADDELRRRCGHDLPASSTTKPVEYLTSPVVTSPFCWQIHRPLIVLPELVLDFDDEELAAILRHENAHLRLGHPLHLFLQRIVEILFWFHPLVWWSSFQAAGQREFVCDRAAARSVGEACACLRSMIQLAEQGGPVAGKLPAGLAFGIKRSLMQERAKRLGFTVEEDSQPTRIERQLPGIVFLAALLLTAFHFPIDVTPTNRSRWSPWPAWSAQVLHTAGIPVRDYEVDNYRRETAHHYGESTF